MTTGTATAGRDEGRRYRKIQAAIVEKDYNKQRIGMKFSTITGLMVLYLVLMSFANAAVNTRSSQFNSSVRNDWLDSNPAAVADMKTATVEINSVSATLEGAIFDEEINKQTDYNLENIIKSGSGNREVSSLNDYEDLKTRMENVFARLTPPAESRDGTEMINLPGSSSDGLPRGDINTNLELLICRGIDNPCGQIKADQGATTAPAEVGIAGQV